MAKEALIKLRCSPELKYRLEQIAARKEMSLSSFVRSHLLEILPELEANTALQEGKQAPYKTQEKKPPDKSSRHRGAGPAHPVPKAR